MCKGFSAKLCRLLKQEWDPHLWACVLLGISTISDEQTKNLRANEFCGSPIAFDLPELYFKDLVLMIISVRINFHECEVEVEE